MKKFLYLDNLNYEGHSHKTNVEGLLDRLRIKNYSLVNTITTTDEVYCMFPSMMNPSVAVSKYNLLTDELVSLYHSHNIKFLFINIVECDLESACDNLYDIIKSKNIKEEDVILITENCKIQNLNKYNLKAFPIIHTPKAISITMLNIGNPIFLEDKKYLFQCYNNVTKAHRMSILSLLKYNNILDKTDWSFLNPQSYYPLKDYTIIYTFFDRNDFKKYIPSYEYILNKGIPKYSEYEGEYIRNINANGEPNHDITYKENPHKHAYINIITESQFELDNTTHITEKTIIPFYFFQLPIFVATPGFVKTVREKFNFDLFDDIIDHSYDDETNHQKRMLKISAELKRLSDNESKIIEFYKNNKERFLKNQEEVLNLPKYTHHYNLFDILDES